MTRQELYYKCLSDEYFVTTASYFIKESIEQAIEDLGLYDEETFTEEQAEEIIDYIKQNLI